MAWKHGLIQGLVVAAGFAASVDGLAASAKPKTAAAVAVPLAEVGGKHITIDQFRDELTRRQGGHDPSGREQLLDNIVRSELLFAAARTAGYEKDPEVIAAVKQAMVGKYLRDNLEPKLAAVIATEQEAEAYYRAHQAEFGAPAQVHVALIKIAMSAKFSPEKKGELLARAEKARSEALRLEPGVPAFGSVAVTYSEDQESRYRGGDVGWLPAAGGDGKWGREVAAAINALKTPGEVSPIVTAADGYYLVKLVEAQPATVKPFAAVKDGVRYQVIQEKRRQMEKEFLAGLKSKITVTVNRDLLYKAFPADEGNGPAPPGLPLR